MATILYSTDLVLSANNEASIIFDDLPDNGTIHQINLGTVGSVDAGTVTIYVDDAPMETSIDVSSGNNIIVNFVDVVLSKIEIAPSDLTAGCFISARLRSW